MTTFTRYRRLTELHLKAGERQVTLENEERYPPKVQIILEPRTGEYGKRAEEAI